MKRAIFLAMAALLAMLILVPMVVAQDTTMMTTAMTMAMTTATATPAADGPLVPASGGPAILLPAAALLLGSGILTYAILRRR
jgi:hypothetical protein